jgi:hypothetical protein
MRITLQDTHRSSHGSLPSATPSWGLSLPLSLALCFGLCFGGAGCADDASTGGDSNGTEDTGSTETGNGDGDGDPSGDGDGDPTGDGDGDPSGDGDGDPLPTEITVGGEVRDFFVMSGIEGANVSVKDLSGFETVSDADGKYSLSGMPPSTEVFFLIDGNEDSYWGGVRPAMLPANDTNNLQLGQVSNQLIDTQLNIVKQQDPEIEPDETKSIIIVRLLQPTAVGASVTFDPPRPPSTSYGVNADNQPVLDSPMIDSSLLPFWVAFNVDPDNDGGAYSITVDHPERECEVLHPVFPTLPRYVTLIDINCPPPGN